jgi:hypothetical protein
LLDQRGQLLRAALGFATLPSPCVKTPEYLDALIKDLQLVHAFGKGQPVANLRRRVEEKLRASR